MSTKNFPVVTNDNDLMIGDGYLFLGAHDADFSDQTLELAGCLNGTTTVTTQIEKARLEAGSPQMLIRVEPQRINLEIQVTLIEINMKRLQKVYGFGDLATAQADTVTVAGETVPLAGKYWTRLAGYAITGTPVVRSAETYATVYTAGTDYQIDTTNGLIRRIPTGSIPNFSEVAVYYTWSRPARETLNLGTSATVGRYPLKFVVPMPDGRRWSLRIWKATPNDSGSLNFQPDQFTQNSISFTALADRTQSPEALLGTLEKEMEAYYTVD